MTTAAAAVLLQLLTGETDTVRLQRRRADDPKIGTPTVNWAACIPESGIFVFSPLRLGMGVIELSHLCKMRPLRLW